MRSSWSRLSTKVADFTFLKSSEFSSYTNIYNKDYTWYLCILHTTLIMKLLFMHRLMNNSICYLKLFQQYARTNFFLNSYKIKSHFSRFRWRSPPPSPGTVHLHKPRHSYFKLSYPAHTGKSTSCPPWTLPSYMCWWGREVDWTLLISMHGKSSIISTNVI